MRTTLKKKLITSCINITLCFVSFTSVSADIMGNRAECYKAPFRNLKSTYECLTVGTPVWRNMKAKRPYIYNLSQECTVDSSVFYRDNDDPLSRQTLKQECIKKSNDKNITIIIFNEKTPFSLEKK